MTRVWLEILIFIGPSPSAHEAGGRGVLSLWFLLCLSVSLMFLGPLNKMANYGRILKFKVLWKQIDKTLQSMGIYGYKLVYMGL